MDTSLYQVHSCRSVSTSNAKVLGMSLKDILKSGQWSTWERHYNKEIVNARESSKYETVILNNALN